MADLDGRLGPPTPGRNLDTRLEGDISQRGADLGQAKAELAAAEASPKGSFVGELLDAPTLIKLGLAVAGGLSGSKDLQALGLGLGTSTLGQVGTDVSEFDEERMVTIDKLEKRVQTQQKLLDNQQQRLMTIMQTQPGLLLDEQGEPVKGATPFELSVKSGLGIEFSPAAMNTRAEMTRDREKVFAIQGGLYEQAMAANRPEQAAQHLSQMFNSVNVPMTIEEAAGLIATPLENVPAVLAQRADVSSVVDLMLWSEQNDKPWWDPEAPKLRPKIETPGGVSADMQARADKGMAKIIKKMNQLKNGSLEEQALWRDYVNNRHKQIKLLDADPGLSNAVRKVYASTRTDEEIMLKSLELLTSTLDNTNAIEVLRTVLPAGTKEEGEAAIGILFQSLFGQTGMALDTMALQNDAERITALSAEELADELAREKKAREGR